MGDHGEWQSGWNKTHAGHKGGVGEGTVLGGNGQAVEHESHYARPSRAMALRSPSSETPLRS